MTTANLVAAAQRCMYGTADSHCGEPAVLHVLLVDGVPTMSCRPHAARWDTEPHHDSHPISGACGLPGTTWMYGLPGHCTIEDIDAEMPARTACASTPA